MVHRRARNIPPVYQQGQYFSGLRIGVNFHNEACHRRDMRVEVAWFLSLVYLLILGYNMVGITIKNCGDGMQKRNQGDRKGAPLLSSHDKYQGDRKGAPLLSSHDKYQGDRKGAPLLYTLLFTLLLLLASCSTGSSTGSTKGTSRTTLSTNNGAIAYSSSPQDVIVRTFYGGGNRGTLEMSPDISIYGDGTYILGPGIHMREGHLSSDTLQQLLHVLVDRDGLLSMQRQQFYDIPDQDMTLLQLNLNGKNYAYYYGQFGFVQESTQDMDAYHHLGQAIATITQSITGVTQPYTNHQMALLVHQDFSPDLTQTIPVWRFPDFTLDAVATYECGVTPPDETGPNADTGCLSFTVPYAAYLPTQTQQEALQTLFKGQQQSVFFEQNTQNYYSAILRPLLPDELPTQMLAMYGSAELSYAGIPLHSGNIPQPTPTATA